MTPLFIVIHKHCSIFLYLMARFEPWIEVHIADLDKNVALHVYNGEQYALAI